MKVAIVGGGPGGLFLAILLMLADARTEPATRYDVTLFERNARDDTFGFGVVFSQETLDNITAADPETMRRIEERFRHWTAIDMRFRGRSMRSDGHAFAALARVELLAILTERAAELGVRLEFRHDVGSLRELAGFDLVVAADGVNSFVRRQLEQDFAPELAVHSSKYIWLGTTAPFDEFAFLFAESAYGLFQAHVYPYDDGHATFIVETDPQTWARAGLDRNAAVPLAPGESDVESVRFCEELFAEHLDGRPMLANASRWLEFRTVRNATWTASGPHAPVVLVGDSAHTAHFSIGSGTKLAMEDAIALAGSLDAHPDDVSTALKAYEVDRRTAVQSVQRAALTSLEWFEGIARYTDLEFEQFCFQLLTRSQRVTYDNLKLRDPAFVRGLDHWLAAQARGQGLDVADGTPPLFFPYRVRGMELPNRIVVSPMAQYSAVDGVPNDWHLVHWGSRAVGGAGLTFTEMTCVSPEGRITPGCCGLWNDEQAAAFARVVDFVHAWTPNKIGLQLGHSGRKGSTKSLWEGEDVPLDDGNWDVMAPSPVRYKPFNQVPHEMTRADMEQVGEEFVAAAQRGAAVGFDLLELHYAHGYLMSTFLSPLANLRDDGYGGSPANRARFPLEVFDAVRAVWPADRPMSVRISATDWVDGGFTGDDAVAFSRLLKDHGCDLVDASSGQVHPDQKPRYGRLYQTPYADRIRHEVGIPTMTVGAVSSVDDANTIIMAGRADLCLLARPHLVDPYWTLNAAMDLGYGGHHWPPQYLSGRSARRREQQP